MDLAPGALPAILPFLVLYNGLSYTEVAGLMFASSCLSSIVQPAFGYWADKSSKPWFMALGIAMSGIGLGVSGLVSNYWLIFIAITLMGVGSSIFHPVAARVVNYTSEKKATGIGIFSVGGNGKLKSFFIFAGYRWGGKYMLAIRSINIDISPCSRIFPERCWNLQQRSWRSPGTNCPMNSAQT